MVGWDIPLGLTDHLQRTHNRTAGLVYFQPVRFAVRSLGWTEIPEEDLTPEKSSRAVNKAIVDLSTGRNDILDNVSKWGDVGLPSVTWIFLYLI